MLDTYLTYGIQNKKFMGPNMGYKIKKIKIVSNKSSIK